MYGKDEQKFIELRSKFVTELEEIESQINDLSSRKEELVGLLDGYMGTVEEEETPSPDPDKMDLDWNISEFVRAYGPVKRSDINDYLKDNYTPEQIRRGLERCKRRGLVKVEGWSKAAVWMAVE